MNRDAPAVDAVAEALGPRVRHQVPLGPLTTYRVGGPAALLLDAHAVADLVDLGQVLGEHPLPVLVVGKGSNLLVLDGGFPGVVVHLGDEFASISIDDTRVTAGGAASMPVVARRTARAGLTGFEWAVGIPGSIGGSVRMNAGGHGSDMAASLISIRVVDLAGGDHDEVPTDALDLSYRSSNLAPSTVVVDATLGLDRGDPATAQAEIDSIVRWRRANQPGGPNAGSVFTNPPDDHAGRLIDEAGCRGLRLGSAQVSPKHANFIQADPGGSADDIWRLMNEVRARVAERTGVELRAETHVVGEPAS
ncbi:MAG: UDP-N-acetylmuramate dehydrogenase [Acidimicrobiales bacterium]